MALPASSWGSCVLCGVPYNELILKDGVCPECQGHVPPAEPLSLEPTESELNETLGTGGYDADDRNTDKM